jgi:hypothetical protein
LCLFDICYDLFFHYSQLLLVLDYVTCIWWSIVGLKFKLEAIWIWANLLNWVIVFFLKSKRVIFTLHLLRHMIFIFTKYSNVNCWHIFQHKWWSLIIENPILLPFVNDFFHFYALCCYDV